MPKKTGDCPLGKVRNPISGLCVKEENLAKLLKKATKEKKTADKAKKETDVAKNQIPQAIKVFSTEKDRVMAAIRSMLAYAGLRVYLMPETGSEICLYRLSHDHDKVAMMTFENGKKVKHIVSMSDFAARESITLFKSAPFKGIHFVMKNSNDVFTVYGPPFRAPISADADDDQVAEKPKKSKKPKTSKKADALKNDGMNGQSKQDKKKITTWNVLASSLYGIDDNDL